ncbi:hypothetical protein NM518_2202 [Neisseria meningitidis NM518]|nr:hypothetical protein NM518_2202 [Neisseria meningitidis NM518]
MGSLHHTAHRIGSQFLHRAVRRRLYCHQLLPLLCLIRLAAVLVNLFVCLAQRIQRIAFQVLRIQHPILLRLCNGRLNLPHLTARTFQIVPIADRFALLLQKRMFRNKIVGPQTAVVCCFLLLDRPHRNQLLLLRLGRLQFRLMAAQSRLQLRILRRPCLILVLRQHLHRLHIGIGET